MRMLLGPGRDRGAAAVEAAIIFPLLILLTFGIIEVSLLLRDVVSVNSLVRTGVRTAQTLPRVPGFAQDTVDAINAAGSAVPRNTFEELWVYKANDDGFPEGATSVAPGSCQTNCIIYRPDPTTGDFVQATDFTGPNPDPDWDSASVNACPGTEIDAVGVYLRVRHQSVTGLLFDDIAVADYAVSRFEPIATTGGTQCGPS